MDHSNTQAVLVERDPNIELVHRYAAMYIASHRSPQTRHAYRIDLQQWFRWLANWQVPPLEAQRTHVELYARDLEDRGLAPATRARRIGTVRGWYSFLIDQELFERANPAQAVKQPPVTNVRQLVALTRRQANDLIQAAEADGPMSFAFVALGLFNGLRISEICAVNVDHIGRDRWHECLRIHGKGDKYDVVALAPPAYRAVQAARGDRTAGPLLLNRAGRRLNRSNAERILKRLCRAKGLPVIAPHGLRRTAITLLLEDGIPLREVQIFARHASPTQTAAYDRRSRSLDQHLGYQLMRAIA